MEDLKRLRHCRQFKPKWTIIHTYMYTDTCTHAHKLTVNALHFQILKWFISRADSHVYHTDTLACTHTQTHSTLQTIFMDSHTGITQTRT